MEGSRYLPFFNAPHFPLPLVIQGTESLAKDIHPFLWHQVQERDLKCFFHTDLNQGIEKSLKLRSFSREVATYSVTL